MSNTDWFIEQYRPKYDKDIVKGKAYHDKAIGLTLEECINHILPLCHESLRADCEAYIRSIWPSIPD